MRDRPFQCQAISRIVARQLGHITRAQLLDLGFSAAWIDHRVRTGELIPVHLGVYAVGHVPRHAHARAMAAVLACGEGAALSHLAAAALWDVRDWPAMLEVTALRERRRPGIRTHRSQRLGRGEVRIHQGIRVTSPVRTVLDLQPRFDDETLVRLVDDLRIADHLGAAALQRLCARSARIDGLLGDGGLTRSRLEQLFRRFVARHGLPMPDINAHLPESGREVDALYPRARLIIEVDSWKYHRSRAAFERDRLKDARALAEGYRTLRTTDRRLQHAGDAEADIILRALAAAHEAQYSPSPRA